jgi:flagellar protein FlaG
MDIRSLKGPAQPVSVFVDYATPVDGAKSTATTAPVEAVRPPVKVADTAQQMQQLKEALNNINETIQAMSPGLEFTVDSESERTVVKVVDQQTKEVLRQMPSEEALSIAKALDKLQGLLIKQQA